MNEEQSEYWNGAAGQRWTEQQGVLDRAIQRFGDAALDAAAAQSGERAIDVGCGCGDTTVALADRVGPSGHVLGLDPSGPMLARARDRVGARTNVDLQQGDAATTAFSPDFDLLFSRFGVMFFEDPAAAFTNLRRALRPTGRLSFVAWRAYEDNAWARILVETVRPLVPDVALPFLGDAPGPYAFADRDRVARILATAGFTNVSIERFDAEFTLGHDLEAALDFATQAGPVARLIDANLQERARTELRRALSPHLTERGLALAGSTWIVTARA